MNRERNNRMKSLIYFGAVIGAGVISVIGAEATEEKSSDAFTETYRTAVIAYNHGDLAAAKSGAEAAQKLKPDESRVELLLGRVALEEKDYATAEKEIKDAAASAHPPELAYEFLGDVYLRQRNFAKARDAYQNFLEAKPKNPDGVLKLIYSELGAGNLAAAAERLLQLDPYNEVNPGYYFAKAAMAKAAGKPAASENHLQMARTMYGNRTFAQYMRTYLELYPLKPTK
jgi:tetratricopeptide (TPR) repeat protein